MTNATHAALADLAARCGIATEYHDIWGKRHATSDETRRALLAAMHLPVDRNPARLLQGLEDDEWRRPLPPVLVVRKGEAIRLPLNLPAADAGRPQRWTLRLEGGETEAAEFTPAALPRLGERHIGGTGLLRFALDLPAMDTTGYHRLELEPAESGQRSAMQLIVVPSVCFQPDAIRDDKSEGGRVWGLTVQLYGIRSRHNWGIGDFTDLRTLVDIAADSGAGIVGVNPLHAIFPDDPGHASPYSPSSRAFTNTLYIDVEAVPEFRESEAARSLVASDHFQARLRCLRAEELVNYAEVAAAKREALELIFQHFREHHLVPDSERGQAFRQFRETQGDILERQARFEAIQAFFRAQDPNVWGWPAWPEAYRDPASPAVAEFAAEHADSVDFFAWLQWLADAQLAEVGRQSWLRGLGIGLYQDLAVGVNPGGAEAWAWQGVFAAGAHAGAPPDDFNLLGQDWGLPPFVPQRLREVAYEPLIEVLRASMRYAGALRIDHVMGLARVFWVPAGLAATHGAYVAYPLEDMLGIVALESQRNQCLVIGEDLGTVPEGFRPRLARADLLSYRPFLFERSDEGAFKPPADYPRHALVAASTHDLPTLQGLWQGADLDLRAVLQLFPSEVLRENMVVSRAQDRARILMALEREHLLPEGASIHPVSVPELSPPFIQAIHAYLARTPAQLLVVQPEDILGIAEQANLPGSRDDQHPNWQRRLTLDLEDWRSDERFLGLGAVLRHERGSAVTAREVAPKAPRVAVIPRATYRLQFNREFTFAQATELIPYLAQLGISHCYASPYLKARAGSGHGYDIVDHAALNPEIGTTEDYEHFVAALHAHGMGQILDVVPNHMGIMGADNAWWLDVLENGPASAHGAFFDIDWNPLNPGLKGKVLLPLLGDHYGVVLNQGELRLEFDALRGEFSLFYYQHRLPVDPGSYPRIAGHRADRLAAALGEHQEHFVELQSLLTAFERLPSRLDGGTSRMLERQRDKDVHKHQLAALCAACPDIAHHLAENLAEFNGRPNDPASFDLLHELIQVQGYRLAYWRIASDEINYRRFFDINDLAALRMEEPAVFDATHRFILNLVAQGQVDGLRIDHPDGLYDPCQYFNRLQERAQGRPLKPGELPPLYLVIEKILADHERLPDDWPIHGATGYRFANLANALLVDAGAERRMTRIYRDFIGDDVDFDDLVHRAKKLIMDTALAGELNVLANRLARIAADSRDTCDFTLNGLREALNEIVASFPVYRTYVSAAGLSADDRRHIEWAVAVAKRRTPAADASIFDFIRSVLTTEIAQGRSDAFVGSVIAFAMKFQQFSSPVMAKGLEDTSFYRYHRLVSLNDVGGEPGRFGVSLAAYHSATRARAQRWPHNMLATSTHDSKRSEDVRARINVLSEMPLAWKQMLKRWARLNRTKKRKIDGLPAPSANDEYLLYQTLIGTWPPGDPASVDLDAYRQRIAAYMIKAVREAKEHSSWVNANSDYESALTDFIAALLAPGEKNPFLADFIPGALSLARHGLFNSLAQTLLKLASPGVPDIYQGCEFLQFNLVDPDNRQAVDYARRSNLLEELRQQFSAPPATWPTALAALTSAMEGDRLKLYLIWRTLQLRQRWPDLFRDGSYQPLLAQGPAASHICAFARELGDRTVIVVVPRLLATLLEGAPVPPEDSTHWQDTSLPLPEGSAAWFDVLSGARIDSGTEPLQIAALLAHFPVALLASPPDIFE